MTCNNSTSYNADVIKALRDWNFALAVFLLFITALLQWGYPGRNKFIWLLKMFVLWLLWPLSIAASVFAILHPISPVSYGLAVVFACVSSLMWLAYFVTSFRLLCRTRSLWSFMPESDMLLNFSLPGRTVVRPVTDDSPALQFFILRGQVWFSGFNLGRASMSELPDVVTVAKTYALVTYKKVLSRNVGGNSGVAIYLKFKVGNHRVQHVSDDNEELAVFVA
ncbi:membrane glycoprotein [Pteropus rufus nobecovirus]|nr:membrane glycoprotein [Pteropus rufus nobecovirus]